ncbi:hypothetical protein [Parvibaculum sp.]|uniref:hypothetical protein n=1 Tax=Parvibaculum sp. TaxID=2024848 RepID=UPI002FDB8716
MIDVWRGGVSDAVAYKFEGRMRFLQELPANAWVRPYAASLKGDGAGLVEIRFQCEKVQHRPIGFFSGAREFTFVFVAIEKGWRFKPRSTIKIANSRKREVIADRSRAHACEFE